MSSNFDYSFSVVDTATRYMSRGWDRNEAFKFARQDQDIARALFLKQESANPVTAEINGWEQYPFESKTLEERETAITELLKEQIIARACVETGREMSDTAYKLSSIYLRALGVRADVPFTTVSLESALSQGISRRDLYLHHEETVTEGLKAFWGKVKNTFIEAFNKVKTWYLKAWDGAKRLGDKAKAIYETADKKQGTIKEQSFDFTGAKFLIINKKVGEPAQLVKTIGTMTKITTTILGKTASTYTNIVDTMSKALEDIAKDIPREVKEDDKSSGGNSGNNQPQNFDIEAKLKAQDDGKFDDVSASTFIKKIIGEADGIKSAFNGIMNEWDVSEWGNHPAFKHLFEKDKGSNATLYRSEVLPGDQYYVVSNLKDGGALTSTADLKSLKDCFGGVMVDVREKGNNLPDSLTVKTLNPSQIMSICDLVMESCKAGLDYKLLFVERDKAYQQLDKALEGVVNDQSNLKGKAVGFLKANAQAAVTIFSKINRIEGAWFKYAFGVFSRAIDYCQVSLGHVE